MPSISAGTVDERALLASARAGDERAFRALVDPCRRALEVHCYRMLGSPPDAEDVAQETLLRAWRSLDHLGRGAPVDAWLLRIATNACLDELERRPRGPGPLVEPYPDARLRDAGTPLADPLARHARGDALDLAFLTAVQRLPDRQRAVLLLRDVLGWTGAEVAALLGSTAPAVDGALERARAAIDRELPTAHPAPPATQRELQRRCVEAWGRADLSGLADLLHPDAVLTRPPDGAVVGAAAVVAFAVAGCGGPGTLVPSATAANGRPAVALRERSAEGASRPIRLLVLDVRGERIAAVRLCRDPRVLAGFGV